MASIKLKLIHCAPMMHILLSGPPLTLKVPGRFQPSGVSLWNSARILLTCRIGLSLISYLPSLATNFTRDRFATTHTFISPKRESVACAHFQLYTNCAFHKRRLLPEIHYFSHILWSEHGQQSPAQSCLTIRFQLLSFSLFTTLFTINHLSFRNALSFYWPLLLSALSTTDVLHAFLLPRVSYRAFFPHVFGLHRSSFLSYILTTADHPSCKAHHSLCFFQFFKSHNVQIPIVDFLFYITVCYSTKAFSFPHKFECALRYPLRQILDTAWNLVDRGVFPLTKKAFTKPCSNFKCYRSNIAL